MTSVEPDERLYIDFKEAEKITETSVKFKTTADRIKFWVRAHEELYPNEDFWQFKQNLVTLKVKENGGNLLMKFHLTTGVVLIQGSNFRKWRSEWYNIFKSRVDDIEADFKGNGIPPMSWHTVPGCQVVTNCESLPDINSSGLSPGSDDDITQRKQVNCPSTNRKDGDNVQSDSSLSDSDSVLLEADDGLSRCDKSCFERIDEVIQKLELGYIHMSESVSENMNGIRSELSELKNDNRKLPVKIYDIIRKEQKTVEKSITELRVAVADHESQRQAIHNLTNQLQNQTQEMWRLQRELAAAQRLRSPANVSAHTPDAPSQRHRQALRGGSAHAGTWYPGSEVWGINTRNTAKTLTAICCITYPAPLLAWVPLNNQGHWYQWHTPRPHIPRPPLSRVLHPNRGPWYQRHPTWPLLSPDSP